MMIFVTNVHTSWSFDLTRILKWFFLSPWYHDKKHRGSSMRVTIWSLYWPKSLSAVSMMAQIPNHITKRKSTPRPQYNTLLPRDFRWIVTPLITPFTSQGYVRVVPTIGGIAVVSEHAYLDFCIILCSSLTGQEIILNATFVAKEDWKKNPVFSPTHPTMHIEKLKH